MEDGEQQEEADGDFFSDADNQAFKAYLDLELARATTGPTCSAPSRFVPL